jgi:serine kinase of HPr protein (carbohydrate metabolism regulator)
LHHLAQRGHRLVTDAAIDLEKRLSRLRRG